MSIALLRRSAVAGCRLPVATYNGGKPVLARFNSTKHDAKPWWFTRKPDEPEPTPWWDEDPAETSEHHPEPWEASVPKNHEDYIRTYTGDGDTALGVQQEIERDDDIDYDAHHDLGNYPQVPSISRQYLPATGWDDMLLRRNFGDPVHEDEELYGMWGPDIPPVEPHVALRHFGVAFLSFVTFGLAVKYVLAPEPHFVRREYPFSGLQKELGSAEGVNAREESMEE